MPNMMHWSDLNGYGEWALNVALDMINSSNEDDILWTKYSTMWRHLYIILTHA